MDGLMGFFRGGGLNRICSFGFMGYRTDYGF